MLAADSHGREVCRRVHIFGRILVPMLECGMVQQGIDTQAGHAEDRNFQQGVQGSKIDNDSADDIGRAGFNFGIVGVIGGDDGFSWAGEQSE